MYFTLTLLMKIHSLIVVQIYLDVQNTKEHLVKTFYSATN